MPRIGGEVTPHSRKADCWVATLGSEFFPNFRQGSPIPTGKLEICWIPTILPNNGKGRRTDKARRQTLINLEKVHFWSSIYQCNSNITLANLGMVFGILCFHGFVINYCALKDPTQFYTSLLVYELNHLLLVSNWGE